MFEEMEQEYSTFLDDMKQDKIFCKYMNQNDYEDEYSHNEISECQIHFIKKVKEYLHKNKPGKYIVVSGWCVFVMTAEEAHKRNITNINQWLVN